jgi:hypothetical protein
MSERPLNESGPQEDVPEVLSAQAMTSRQQQFLRYFTAILIDLTVLNLFDQYWDAVAIPDFTISLFAAIVLQVLLQATLALEHRVAVFWNARSGVGAKVGRVFFAWLILFLSKFVILAILNATFGHEVAFTGPLHGVPAFIVVIMAMLAAEELVLRLYRALR